MNSRRESMRKIERVYFLEMEKQTAEIEFGPNLSNLLAEYHTTDKTHLSICS